MKYIWKATGIREDYIYFEFLLRSYKFTIISPSTFHATFQHIFYYVVLEENHLTLLISNPVLGGISPKFCPYSAVPAREQETPNYSKTREE